MIADAFGPVKLETLLGACALVCYYVVIVSCMALARHTCQGRTQTYDLRPGYKYGTCRIEDTTSCVSYRD